MKYVESREERIRWRIQGVLAGFFALSFAFILVILIWAIISYLLTAFALYSMAKNDGATDGVLAVYSVFE